MGPSHIRMKLNRCSRLSKLCLKQVDKERLKPILKDKFHGKCNLTQHSLILVSASPQIFQNIFMHSIKHLKRNISKWFSQSDNPSDWNNYTWLASDQIFLPCFMKFKQPYLRSLKCLSQSEALVAILDFWPV